MDEYRGDCVIKSIFWIYSVARTLINNNNSKFVKSMEWKFGWRTWWMIGGWRIRLADWAALNYGLMVPIKLRIKWGNDKMNYFPIKIQYLLTAASRDRAVTIVGYSSSDGGDGGDGGDDGLSLQLRCGRYFLCWNFLPGGGWMPNESDAETK